MHRCAQTHAASKFSLEIRILQNLCDTLDMGTGMNWEHAHPFCSTNNETLHPDKTCGVPHWQLVERVSWHNDASFYHIDIRSKILELGTSKTYG